MPILLVFSTLSVWLSKAGVARGTITLFSWAGFAYAFKFLWSPIVDKINISFFKDGSKKKLAINCSDINNNITNINFVYRSTEKFKNHSNMYNFSRFFSATQDIIIDAFRIESVNQNKQGPLSSMYIAGYRIGMLIGGAGSLWLASYWGVEQYDQSVWKKVYLTMALLMLIGIFANIISKDPSKFEIKSKNTMQHLRLFL